MVFSLHCSGQEVFVVVIVFTLECNRALLYQSVTTSDSFFTVLFVRLLNKTHFLKELVSLYLNVILISLLNRFNLISHQLSFRSQIIPVCLVFLILESFYPQHVSKCFTYLCRIQNWTEFFNSLMGIGWNGKITPFLFLMHLEICCVVWKTMLFSVQLASAWPLSYL